jgi:hypothetical protein
MWRAVYVAKMPTLAQRCRIVLDWLLDAIFGRTIAEVPFEPPGRLSAFLRHSLPAHTQGS